MTAKRESISQNDVYAMKTYLLNKKNVALHNLEHEPATWEVGNIGNSALEEQQQQQEEEQHETCILENSTHTQIHSTACVTSSPSPEVFLPHSPFRTSASPQLLGSEAFNWETAHNEQPILEEEEEEHREEKTGMMNVEQFGYTLLYTAVEKEVQVIICAINVDAVEHHGKAPRLVIAFRGTATARNARYDLRLSRRVWPEMYNAELNNESENVSQTQHFEELQQNKPRSEIYERSWEPEGNSNNHHNGNSTNYWWNRKSTGALQNGKHTLHANWARRCLHAFQNHTRLHPTVHTGFLKLWLALQPRIQTHLMHILTSHPDVVFRIFTTGHSMGGALACLAAYSTTILLRRINYPIPDITVYTFGQPRIGNLTFKQIYNKTVPRTFRVVNENDLVGTMSILGGYHIGIEVAIDRHGNFIVKPTAIETFFRPTKGHGLAFVQHMLSSYCISLNAIAENTSCKARCLKPYIQLSRNETEQTFTESGNDNNNSHLNDTVDAPTFNFYSNYKHNNNNENKSVNSSSICDINHTNDNYSGTSHIPTPLSHSFTAIPPNEFTPHELQEEEEEEEQFSQQACASSNLYSVRRSDYQAVNY